MAVRGILLHIPFPSPTVSKEERSQRKPAPLSPCFIAKGRVPCEGNKASSTALEMSREVRASFTAFPEQLSGDLGVAFSGGKDTQRSTATAPDGLPQNHPYHPP